MLLVVRPNESIASSAWPGASSASPLSAMRQVWRSSRLTRKSMLAPAYGPAAGHARERPWIGSVRYWVWDKLGAIPADLRYRRILMQHRFLGLGIGAAAVLAFPATSMAKTIDVFRGDKIQHAVHEAHSGDVIQVHEGTYRGSVESTTNGLTLRGAGADKKDGTVIKPKQTKRCQGGTDGICVLPHKKGGRKARTNDTVIEGFLIRGFKGSGVLAIGAKHTTVQHNKFDAAGEYGAAAFGSIRTKFLHNLATGNDEAGLYVRDSSHGRVLRNEAVHNCLGIGLINTGAPGDVRTWHVLNDEVDSNNRFCKSEGGAPPLSGTGIALLGAKKGVVRNNSVRSNKPAQPAPYAGGIVVASGKPLGGSDSAHNVIARNRALKNKP